MFTYIQRTAPAYLCQLIKQYQARRSLCSTDQHLLVKGKPCTKIYGDWAFKNFAPYLWNDLPLEIRDIDKVESFDSAIKTFLFKESY